MFASYQHQVVLNIILWLKKLGFRKVVCMRMVLMTQSLASTLNLTWKFMDFATFKLPLKITQKCTLENKPWKHDFRVVVSLLCSPGLQWHKSSVVTIAVFLRIYFWQDHALGPSMKHDRTCGYTRSFGELFCALYQVLSPHPMVDVGCIS